VQSGEQWQSSIKGIETLMHNVLQGTAGVGVGSFLFHATLKHEAQLLDELPMIYTSA
jgi:hypothetical protein